MILSLSGYKSRNFSKISSLVALISHLGSKRIKHKKYVDDYTNILHPQHNQDCDDNENGYFVW